MQRRFYTNELQHFLCLVDAELSKSCTLVLIGGAAVSLGYCPDHAIAEIELWSSSDSVIWTAAERASEKIPRPIRLRQALVGQPRLSFEDRLWPVRIDGLRFLTLLVPEAHDQVLLSAVRADPSVPLVDLHRNHPLSLGTLLERYNEMKGQVSVPRARFKASFLGVVVKLFGKAKADELENAPEGVSEGVDRATCRLPCSQARPSGSDPVIPIPTPGRR